MNPIIIIGTGQAGYSLAREFRKFNSNDPLVLVTADDGSAYYKPNLSKAFAMGKKSGDLVTDTAEGMAEKLQANIRTHARVTAINADEHSITIGEERLPYKKLVLAMGAHAFKVSVAGDAAADVLTVNNLDDYHRFRNKLEGRKHIAIMGGGLIGCEFANDLAATNFKVSIIDPAPWPLGRMLPELPAGALQHKLGELSVDWHFGATVKQCLHHDSGYHLVLSDDLQIDCDVVLSAIGLRANTMLAEVAALDINHGIKVDRYLRSSGKDIFAIGDCAEVEGLLLPYIAPVVRASKALAATLNGKETSLMYPHMPVIVKTPACPTVVLPHHPQQVGEGYDWEALYKSNDDQLKGFASMVKGVVRHNELVGYMEPLLA